MKEATKGQFKQAVLEHVHDLIERLRKQGYGKAFINRCVSEYLTGLLNGAEFMMAYHGIMTPEELSQCVHEVTKSIGQTVVTRSPFTESKSKPGNSSPD